MAQYLKISAYIGGSCNSNLKKIIEYIGTQYGKLAKKEGYTNKKYYESGLHFIAKIFGTRRKNIIRLMVEPNRKKNHKNKQWCYHKRLYGKAFDYILKLLYKCNDRVYVKDLLYKLFNDICKESGHGSDLAKVCSNALLYWQKEILEIHKISSNISFDDRKDAKKILDHISEFDKPLPETTGKWL